MRHRPVSLPRAFPVLAILIPAALIVVPVHTGASNHSPCDGSLGTLNTSVGVGTLNEAYETGMRVGGTRGNSYQIHFAASGQFAYRVDICGDNGEFWYEWCHGKAVGAAVCPVAIFPPEWWGTSMRLVIYNQPNDGLPIAYEMAAIKTSG